MELREHIAKSIRKFLNEYISNDMIYLRDYLSMSEETIITYLPHEYSYLFDDFLVETSIEFERPKQIKQTNYADEPEEEVDMFDDNNNIELIYWLENNNKEVFKAFGEYLYYKIKNQELPISDADYPAWFYFDNDPVLIKNQWLIHFTDDAESISRDGFKYGVDDMTKLGLTTSLGEFDKKYGGYNFAYLLSNFDVYGRSGLGRGEPYKYGKEAVIFNASGIKVYHYGDEEPQVIFYGKTATNIVPIIAGENKDWAIRNKNGSILFEDDKLKVVVDWFIKNYQQYRKSILNEDKTYDKMLSLEKWYDNERKKLDAIQDFKIWNFKSKSLQKQYFNKKNQLNKKDNPYGIEGDMNVSYIYHYTDGSALISIINDNSLIGGWAGDSYGGISFTSHPNLHKRGFTFLYPNEYSEGKHQNNVGVKMKFDFNQMMRDGFRFKKGSEHMGTYSGEDEIRLLKNELENPMKYVKEIIIFKDKEKEYLKLANLLNNKNIKYKIV